MLEWLQNAFDAIATSWQWPNLDLVASSPPQSGSIFGFDDYLAALALLLVVVLTSDFRYRFRMAINGYRGTAFFAGLAVGLSVLFVDVWYQNSMPVPTILGNANNLKAVIALLFIAFVFRALYLVAMQPVGFRKRNAGNFFGVAYEIIHEGVPERLQVLADEIGASARDIVHFASLDQRRQKPLRRPRSYKEGRRMRKRRQNSPQAFAHNLLLLLGDRRFCSQIVANSPTVALRLFVELQKRPLVSLPIYQFARNVGQEFIVNTRSAFYEEDSGFYSGYLGFAQPITRIIFGDYEFVESCAGQGASPLDNDGTRFRNYDEDQQAAFNRAALSFLEAYLKRTKGRAHFHSYALARLMYALRADVMSTYKLDGVEDLVPHPAYRQLRSVVSFVTDAIELVERHAAPARTLRVVKDFRQNIYDMLAELIFEIIVSAASVREPAWTAWVVQHNTVWGAIFGLRDGRASRTIEAKVRRLMYDEIREMDDFANFKGARILGFLLLVCRLSPPDRHSNYRRQDYAIFAKALSWTARNYMRLVRDHPKVAQAMVYGSTSFDPKGRRLLRTQDRDTEASPKITELKLDPIPRRRRALRMKE